MRLLLNESKRDDFLNKYIEMLKGYGINIPNIGLIKSKFLNKFGFEGGITNLSLRSNYYLEGVTKYYFNGDLTNNKDLSLLKPECWEEGSSVQDDWKTDVCKQINALILIFRNSYIDSVGSSFLEPEDFGELDLKTLLRKYGAKIRKELGMAPKKKKQEIDSNPNVGNNYTFDIMYNYEMCRQYFQPTNPGAWCITYGQHHYNYYVKDLKIHYVIFRKDGWENIPRPKDPLKEPGFTREKPHDAFGNSLIAVLQSNTSPEPVYITSRWNHGYEVSCEADHAYTKEEFQQITGVTDDDLKRIYDIWKQNKTNNGSSSGAETRKEKLKTIRVAKYTQMRINNGENPNDFLYVRRILNGSGEIKKSITLCSFKHTEGHEYPEGVAFLVDMGKILFDTIGDNSYIWIDMYYNNYLHYSLNCNRSHNMIYNIKTHKFIEIDGVNMFKKISREPYSFEDITYITVAQSTKEYAIIDIKNGQVVVLPNGSKWFNKLKTQRSYYYYDDGKIKCTVLTNEDIVVEIIYDESSQEKYFYNTHKKQFIDIPNNFLKIGNRNNNGFQPSDEELETMKPTIAGNNQFFGIYGVSYCGEGHLRGMRTNIIAIKDNEILSVGNLKSFSAIRRFSFVIQNLLELNLPNSSICTICDAEKFAFVGDDKGPIFYTEEYSPNVSEGCPNYVILSNYDLIIRSYNTTRPEAKCDGAYILNTDNMTLLKNPFETNKKNQFKFLFTPMTSVRPENFYIYTGADTEFSSLSYYGRKIANSDIDSDFDSSIRKIDIQKLLSMPELNVPVKYYSNNIHLNTNNTNFTIDDIQQMAEMVLRQLMVIM